MNKAIFNKLKRSIRNGGDMQYVRARWMELVRDYFSNHDYGFANAKSLQEILSLLQEAGYTLEKTSKPNIKKAYSGTDTTTDYTLKKGVYTIKLRSTVSRYRSLYSHDDQNRYSLKATAKLPNLGELQIDHAGDFKARLAELEEFEVHFEEYQDEMLMELQKYQKQINIGTTTIDAVLNTVMPPLGLTYYVEREGTDTILLVKLNYSRLIYFKLLPTMDMTALTDLATHIKMIQQAFDKIGKLNVKVLRTNRYVPWITPESAQTDAEDKAE